MDRLRSQIYKSWVGRNELHFAFQASKDKQRMMATTRHISRQRCRRKEWNGEMGAREEGHAVQNPPLCKIIKVSSTRNR